MNMKKLTGFLAIALCLAFASSTNAMEVTFSDIANTDGNDASGYDTTATMANLLDGNVLDIGVLPYSISNANAASMVDTLTVTVTAPAGFEITTVRYTESGLYNASNGFAAATIQLLANTAEFGQDGAAPGSMAFFNSNGGWGPLNQEIVFDAGVSSADVSIQNTLFVGNADISKTGASLTVELQAVPLPPAIWMLGSAIFGLIAVRRRS